MFAKLYTQSFENDLFPNIFSEDTALSWASRETVELLEKLGSPPPVLVDEFFDIVGCFTKSDAFAERIYPPAVKMPPVAALSLARYRHVLQRAHSAYDEVGLTDYGPTPDEAFEHIGAWRAKQASRGRPLDDLTTAVQLCALYHGLPETLVITRDLMPLLRECLVIDRIINDPFSAAHEDAERTFGIAISCVLHFVGTHLGRCIARHAVPPHAANRPFVSEFVHGYAGLLSLAFSDDVFARRSDILPHTRRMFVHAPVAFAGNLIV